MSKILVTGASGFIGRALTPRLAAMGWEVVSMNSTDGDIARWQSLDRFATQDIEYAIHLAGKIFVPDSWDDPQPFFQTNVLGTANILNFCSKRRIPVTYVSAYVYGHPKSLPISEDSLIQPSNPYALTKRLAEQACEFYASAYDLPVTTLRPFNAFGIGQAESFLIPDIINQVLDAREKITVKDLAPRRDYVYLDDLVAALLATLDEPGGYRVFNIGSGISLSVQEVIDVIQDTAGTQKRVVCKHAPRTNELTDVVADISKAGNELEWYPKHSFREGIENIIRSERKKNRYE